MAQLSGGTLAPIRMDSLNISDLMNGDPLIRDGSTFQVDHGSARSDTLRGVSFLYGDPGTPGADQLVFGLLFRIERTSGDQILLEVTGLSTALQRMTKILREEGNPNAMAYTFMHDDDMYGTGFADYLRGYDGNDHLFGGEGADTLQGGKGNDHLYGQSATGGSDGNDSIAGDEGLDYLQGNAGNDTLDGGAGQDRIQGGQGNDSILGAAGDDTVNGNLGNDTLNGGDGSDSLRGGQGNDSIVGGGGNDSLSGDVGSDTLSGGTGNDVFLFGGSSSLIGGGGADLISDFANGVDKIDVGYTVSAVLAGDTAQPSLASAATAAQMLFNGHAGNAEVASVAVGGDTYLFFSSDGGAIADSVLRLSRVSISAIEVSDFL